MGERRTSGTDGFPPEALEDYEERAAIMEYDGGLQRADAERRAAERVRRRWACSWCDDGRADEDCPMCGRRRRRG